MADGYVYRISIRDPDSTTRREFYGTQEDWSVNGRMTLLLLRTVYTHGPMQMRGYRYTGTRPANDLYLQDLAATKPLPGHFYVRNHEKRVCYSSMGWDRCSDLYRPSALVSLVCNRWKHEGEGESWFDNTISIVKPKGGVMLSYDSPVWAQSDWTKNLDYTSDFLIGDKWEGDDDE